MYVKGGGGLAAGYEYREGVNGELELWKDGTKVSTQSPNGSWFKDNISTGVGSLHLGGDGSSGIAHSISSCGQNVGFLNEFSRANTDDKLFFFPVWQGIESNGSGLATPSVLEFGALQYDSYPNGQPATPDKIVPYLFNLDATSNSATFAVSIVTGEAYSGELTNSINARVTSAEIYSVVSDVNFVAGQTITIKYRYPFFVRTGDTLTLSLRKADGSPLLVRAGQTRLTEPYRSLRMRTFTDSGIAKANGWTRLRWTITDTNGDLSSRAVISNRAVVSDNNGLPLASSTTADELDNIRGGKVISGATTITDGDGFVMNDGGTMLQVAASRLWAYISGKLTGAISNVLTSNLSANVVVRTDGNGKIASGAAYTDAIRPYKTAVIKVRQENQNVPTLTVLENNTGATFTADRFGVGQYKIYASPAIFNANTGVTISSSQASAIISAGVSSTSELILGAFAGMAFVDGVMQNNGTTLEIRVYP